MPLRLEGNTRQWGHHESEQPSWAGRLGGAEQGRSLQYSSRISVSWTSLKIGKTWYPLTKKNQRCWGWMILVHREIVICPPGSASWLFPWGLRCEQLSWAWGFTLIGVFLATLRYDLWCFWLPSVQVVFVAHGYEGWAWDSSASEPLVWALMSISICVKKKSWFCICATPSSLRWPSLSHGLLQPLVHLILAQGIITLYFDDFKNIWCLWY